MERLTQQELLNIRDQHESWLRSQAGVEGTGVGLGRGGDLCLKVFTNQVSAATRNAIHERLVDLPPDQLSLEEIGKVRKQSG